MAKLGDLAQLIRSKNAGAFTLTFDVMFREEEVYRRVLAANVLTREELRQALPDAGRRSHVLYP